jgi:hypothetical protein
MKFCACWPDAARSESPPAILRALSNMVVNAIRALLHRRVEVDDGAFGRTDAGPDGGERGADGAHTDPDADALLDGVAEVVDAAGGVAELTRGGGGELADVIGGADGGLRDPAQDLACRILRGDQYSELGLRDRHRPRQLPALSRTRGSALRTRWPPASDPLLSSQG